jgi:hypothetical protein
MSNLTDGPTIVQVARFKRPTDEIEATHAKVEAAIEVEREI